MLPRTVRRRLSTYDPRNVFAQILKREITAEMVYQDDKCVAFRDVQPKAPIHVLVIPREPITGIEAAEPKHAPLLGHLMLTAAAVAKQEGLGDGYRLVLNQGEQGCQSVQHLHVHVLGGRQMTWPPG